MSIVVAVEFVIRARLGTLLGPIGLRDGPARPSYRAKIASGLQTNGPARSFPCCCRAKLGFS